MVPARSLNEAKTLEAGFAHRGMGLQKPEKARPEARAGLVCGTAGTATTQPSTKRHFLRDVAQSLFRLFHCGPALRNGTGTGSYGLVADVERRVSAQPEITAKVRDLGPV